MLASQLVLINRAPHESAVPEKCRFASSITPNTDLTTAGGSALRVGMSAELMSLER